MCQQRRCKVPLRLRWPLDVTRGPGLPHASPTRPAARLWPSGEHSRSSQGRPHWQGPGAGGTSTTLHAPYPTPAPRAAPAGAVRDAGRVAGQLRAGVRGAAGARAGAAAAARPALAARADLRQHGRHARDRALARVHGAPPPRPATGKSVASLRGCSAETAVSTLRGCLAPQLFVVASASGFEWRRTEQFLGWKHLRICVYICTAWGHASFCLRSQL